MSIVEIEIVIEIETSKSKNNIINKKNFFCI